MNTELIGFDDWLNSRLKPYWRRTAKNRFGAALDRLWFRYNPPRTEWWVRLAQWCIRRYKAGAGEYRYWRNVRL